MLPEWRDGRGWSRFAGNLSKVVDFLEATAVPMGKMKGVKVRTKAGVGVPSYAAALRALVMHPATEASSAVVDGDPLGIVKSVDFRGNIQFGERYDQGFRPCHFAADLCNVSYLS